MNNSLRFRWAFVSIFSLIINSVSIGQPTTWAQPGAHWYYTIGDSVPIGYYGYYEIWEDGDTIFNNSLTCNILRTHEKAIQFWNGNNIYENYGPTLYTYMSNDTVYCYYLNQFHVLFVNNILPGQSWLTGPDIYNFCPSDTIIIDSAMTVNINGVNMNRYVPIVPTWSWPSGGPGIYYHSPIYERFGSTGFFLPVPMCVTDIAFGPIRCYSDNSFTYSTGAVPFCDYITAIEDELPALQFFKITPNPAHDEITVNSDISKITPEEICEIYNVIGNKVMTFKITKSVQQINISNLPPGNFYIKIKNRPQLKSVSFIKL